MADLKLSKVTKVFDKNVSAVKNVSFNVHDREFTVLLGPSGCGKTTILRLIAGLEDITEGEIFIDNQCVNEIPPNKRDIAMVFQNYALYPHLSVYDNIAFGLRMRRNPKEEIDKKVTKAAEILEIMDLLKRKPRQLSGGERQRVALGRAIVRQPRLFLFDEPLSNLDAKLRVQMRAEIARLHKRLSATVIYVTHDQVEAMTLGEKIVVLKDGEVQQVGAPMEIYNYPNNRFVAGFIGSPPMNFIKGTIKKQNESLVFSNHSLTMQLNRDFEKFTDHEVIIGIRPIDFSYTTGTNVRIAVEVVEPIGNETYVYGKCGEIMMQARVPEGVNPKSGQYLELKVNLEKIYLFDGKTEKTLK